MVQSATMTPNVDLVTPSDKKQAMARAAADDVAARADIAISLFSEGKEAFLEREAYELIRELAEAVRALSELVGAPSRA